MKHEIDGNRLIITIDDEEQAELQKEHEENPDFSSDDFLHEFLEPLVANSELDWVYPEDTGDMTDAPMLGIYGEETNSKTGPYGAVQVGHWDGKNWYDPIVERWAYMDYQIKTPLLDLLKSKQVIFTR